MATRKRPPRSWDVDSLLLLGKREGAKSQYLKAVPVLILEKWVKEGRKEREANWVETTDLKKRLESSGLRSFKLKGSSVVLAALSRIQTARNLTRPSLIEYQKEGLFFEINLPHYEPLLQEYRQKYRELYPEDYKKLFPEREPEWELPSLPKGPREAEAARAESEVQEEIQRLLAPVEQALRDQQQVVARLTEENQRLQTELVAFREGTRGFSFVHTSPDFHDSSYKAKVASIRDTIAAMIQRARHSIRISTRQMDMFEDDLIRLKGSIPELEITVLSRGPENAEGPRKQIARRAHERMMAAGIKLPVEQDLLHSRMVIIDDRELLVSSADLDYTQMEKEFNSGIWTDSPQVIAEAMYFFDNLLRSPTVRKTDARKG